jgi:hypothetical protein
LPTPFSGLRAALVPSGWESSFGDAICIAVESSPSVGLAVVDSMLQPGFKGFVHPYPGCDRSMCETKQITELMPAQP